MPRPIKSGKLHIFRAQGPVEREVVLTGAEMVKLYAGGLLIKDAGAEKEASGAYIEEGEPFQNLAAAVKSNGANRHVGGPPVCHMEAWQTDRR